MVNCSENIQIREFDRTPVWESHHNDLTVTNSTLYNAQVSLFIIFKN